jgi:hypothetical protein
MRHAFPDALTTGWDHLLPTIAIPDPDDTHVVAAALAAGTQLIVTNDRRGFTTGLPPGLTTQHPDDFLLDALDLAPATVMAAVHAVVARTGRHGPARSPHDLVDHLGKTGAPFNIRSAATVTIMDGREFWQATRHEGRDRGYRSGTRGSLEVSCRPS